MNLSFYIAKRYIFSKKSHNAINVISLISVCGIAVATMAMVCALSVFNGFTDVVIKSFSTIDPELQITAVKGKVFDPTTAKIQKIREIPEIDIISESLEENAMITFEDRQTPALIKGVSPEFMKLAKAQDILLDGDFLLKDGDVQFCVIGAGLAMNLGARANYIAPVDIYAPKRDVKVNLANPSTAFSKATAYPAGVFALNQAKYDEQLAFVTIELAREIFRYDKEVSSLDIKLKDIKNVDKVKEQLKQILGEDYFVKDRFEQQKESFNMVKIEKWITFLILAFILVIAVFNIIGSLSILILDKEYDIQILRNMGAGNKLIVNIFKIEGWLISLFGAAIGLIIGIALSLAQQHYGFIKLGEISGAFIIDAYPVSVQFLDIISIFFTVCIIGFLAVLYPTNNLKKHLKK